MTTVESNTSSVHPGEHATDETLARLLDEETLAEERVAVAHATACVACQARIDSLRRRRARLTALLVATDGPTMPVPNVDDLMAQAEQRRTARVRGCNSVGISMRPGVRHLRRPTRRALIGGVFLLAGAALAAQPVTRWMIARWNNETVRQPLPPAPSSTATVPAAPAGIAFIPQPGEFTIRYDSAPTSGTLTLMRASDSKVTVDIVSGARDEGLFVLPSGLRIRNSPTSVANYRVQVPAGIARVELNIGMGFRARRVTVNLESDRAQTVQLSR